MPAHIRLAVSDDAQSLPRIERSAAQAFHGIAELSWLADAPVMTVDRHRALIAQSTCWIAVDTQEQPQGFLSAERQGSDLHIHELSVSQPMQGHGLGRKLLEAAMEHARSNQLHCVTLTTFTQVPWNAPFYQRLGFEQHTGATLDERLAEILAREYACGFEAGSRCAMSWQVIGDSVEEPGTKEVVPEKPDNPR
ncbi:GNAT family N-acetyltransferase [Pseudomonas sp. C2B4]|uniref:GNAT family N-acetyltransferase n=1 Tax=Pseudomonas sp. C2B4 TaxID=2735270 RepID=UPI0015862600|nr:GNAT family N-acetyltransferase [Pseudomonas sp. C2B4]NUU38084.1 GNAT family N-acetyltransferase [Pseudomonas sp. C2B4]